MSLTRKRKKELKRLRSSAEELWGQQQEVLAHANSVAAEARKQAAYYTREEIAPRVREGYDSYVRPAAETAGKVAGAARDRFVGDVIPAVGSAVGTALSVVDHARAARAAAFSGDFAKARKEITRKVKVPAKKSGPGAGTIVAISLGAIAAVGVLYAVWQTFRADDELWVADEEPTAPAAE
ncbi:hypothetical protein LLS1_01040 [Leifsonia sp. LS1]|uniref:hypothetical protein n=1 Tax=unclassified Leifsonia TaxID=2663824 RepID=UPI001CBD3A59|nr:MULTISPECIES: hypothetical protein [unclassified Leifsonia]UAJ79552.1 hypothetical protein IT072_00080 [Leifsonia sp. ZF2019]GIT78435.1 hypothetical protein LLS1_01040 [Leifsonia sp. LS1]